MRYKDIYDVRLHRDDHWLDTIHLCGALEPLFRLTTQYRYKTSGLIGDEWRISSVWQCTPEMAARMRGDLATEGSSHWLSFDGPYSGKLDGGCAALFPGLYSSQPNIHEVPITAIEFVRKRRLLYRSTYDGEAMPLLICAGHLPWAFVQAGDEPLGTNEAWNDMQRLCFQPGCAAAAVSTYRLKQCYHSDGSLARATHGGLHGTTRGLVRRFCLRHLRRGDCGLEDADSNYEVLEGPGPRDAHGWQGDVSPAETMIL